jgi:predicted RNase H-like nuclease (RuvC/YqgF family)
VEELKHFKIFTAEQLVGMPDNVAQRFMGINELKRRVQAFLDAANSNVPMQKLQTELADRDNQLDVLRRALKEQGEKIEQLSKTKK